MSNALKDQTKRLFYIALEIALERYDENIISKIPSEEYLIKKYHFSKSFENKMQNLILKQRKQNEKNRYSNKKFIFRKIAAGIVVIVTVGLETSLGVSAVRAEFLNIFSEIKNVYVTLCNQNQENLILDWEEYPSHWNNYWIPTFFPKGYVISDMQDSKIFKKITYKNQASSIIIFNQLTNPFEIKNEDGNTVIRKIKELEKDGILNQKKTDKGIYNILTWSGDGIFFKLESYENSKTLVKMAKSIVKID